MTSQKNQTLSAGVTPANPSPLPGSKEAKRMTVTSGRKCLELYGKSSRLGLLRKTLLATSIWGSTKCYLTWKAKATKRNRLLFQLVPSTPVTDETESGLWPTPTSQEAGVMNPEILTDKNGAAPKRGERVYNRRTGKHVQMTLGRAVNLWATPNTMDHLPLRSPESLKRQAATTRKGRSWPANLREQVHPEVVDAWKMWATPRASEHKDVGPVGSKSHMHQLNRDYLCAQVKDSSFPTGKLNPEWTEWLMGYPIGHTELKPLATL